MDPRCRVEMLGPLRLVRGGQIVTRLGTPKMGALLVLLALRPGAHAREQVLDLFWPEMDLAEGRNNLNTTLSGLRRLLEPPDVRRGTVLTTSHAAIGLDPAAITTDVADFERLCDEATRAADPAERADRWTQAVLLVRGGFQAGNYQDWAVREAERLSVRLVGAWDGLGDVLEVQGRWAEAADVARRRLDADPYDDAAQAALIRRLARAGQHDRAREAARRSAAFYRDEFGGEPPAPVRDALGQAPSAPSGPRRPSRVAPAFPPMPTPRTTEDGRWEEERREDGRQGPAATPFWLSRFFGRDAEIAHLAGLLLQDKGTRDCPGFPPHSVRLLTLTGMGGTGKTRLAGEFLRQARERFGVWCGFVPLADLTSSAQVPAQIAHALGLPPAPDKPPLEQVIAFFQGRERPGAAPALLVLDNAEHMLDDPERGLVETVRELLAQTSGLSVLCTSRRPLGLQGERLLPLAPLPLPDPSFWEDPSLWEAPDALEALGRVPSVALYVDRAQTVRPDFGLTGVNGPSVAGLCRQLEGSPLALELAASWVRLLPPRRMWERLSQGEGLPAGRDADRPARHRSLDAALDWSWRLLPPAPQRLLARLSVFRGGWTLRAAEAVGDTPDALADLAALEEASLVTSREDADGEVRFGLLETVRRFAGERLGQTDDEVATRRRHETFFLTLARDAAAHLRGAAQRPWLDALEADHDNLRLALDECASLPHCDDDLLRVAAGLAPFWRARGHLREGHERLRSLLSRPEASLPRAARVDALNRMGELAVLMAAYDEAQTCHAEAREGAYALGYAEGEADALLGLGTVAYWHREYPAAFAFFEESLEHRPREDWGTAAALHSLGNLALRWDGGGDALSFLERALDLRRRQHDTLGVAGTLGALSQAAMARGDHAGTVGHIAEAFILFDAAGQRWTAALCLSGLSDVAEARGDVPRAVRLLGAAVTLRERFHYPQPPAEHAGYAEHLKDLRARVGSPVFDAAWAEGRAMSWEQTVAYALDKPPA